MTTALVQAFHVASLSYTGGNPSTTLREITGQVLRAARSDSGVLLSLTALLPTLPPQAASWFAVTLGSAIESGPGVELTAPPVVSLLLSWLPRLPRATEPQGQLPEANAEQATLLAAFPNLCQAAVAHLARQPALRRELSHDSVLLARLEELEACSYGASWLRELLRRSSSKLVVLHAPSGRGFELQYRNVARCFHLFTLIQLCLGERVPGGREPDARLAAVASGELYEPANDSACWHFSDPNSKEAVIGASIWGEAQVSTIPRVDDTQVIVLWPTLLGSRSWDSSFFGMPLAAAPPGITLEAELTAEGARAWLARLGIPVG